MVMHISPNRHSWNARRVIEMQEEIKQQENKVNSTHGLFNKIKEKHILRKMIRRHTQHGSEVLEYEAKLQQEQH